MEAVTFTERDAIVIPDVCVSCGGATDGANVRQVAAFRERVYWLDFPICGDCLCARRIARRCEAALYAFWFAVGAVAVTGWHFNVSMILGQSVGVPGLALAVAAGGSLGCCVAAITAHDRLRSWLSAAVIDRAEAGLAPVHVSTHHNGPGKPRTVSVRFKNARYAAEFRGSNRLDG